MSARKKIRKLTRQYPTADEIKKILDSLDKVPGDDRATAIMCVSLMEGALEKILHASLIRKEPEFVRSLFENRGPLSDFYSKILIASAFNIISKAQAEELQLLNAIRNAFAHSTAEITSKRRKLLRP